MAIGDTPNQNLFGTNYNAEEEERKKAELAAQGAMMGAGSPASAFGQAPAVNPFSMEAAGQVNSMMQPQSLEATPQAPNPTTFLPYADDVAPPSASALSVFTPGGEVKPNIDVNAITPSPEMTSKAAPKNALLEMLERADEREAQGLPRQDAPGIIDAPVESLSGGAQEQGMDISQRAIANAQGQEATVPPPAQTLSQFMRYEDAPEQRTEQFVDAQGRMRFRPTQEALQLQAQGAVAQPPVDSAVSTTVAQPPVDALSSFEKDSLARQQRIGGTGSFEGDSEAREARLDARPDFNEAISDRDRRAARGEGLSQADARDLAQGMDPNASEGQRMRALEIQSRLGLGQFKPEKELTDLEKREIESRIRGRDADIAATERKGGFEPRVIDVGGERAMELSPGYFQQIAKDKPNKTGLQTTLENLQADLKSGRLSQEQHDIAVGNATNLYIGLKQPKPNEIDVTDQVKAIREDAMGATLPEGADAGDVKSYATEAEAKAAGAKGEVIIGGRRAIIE